MKLVLIPRSTLKFKSVPQLPGAVLGTSPIVVTAAGLAYTVSLNLPALLTSLNAYYQPVNTNLLFPPVNVLTYIPTTEHAAIRNFTATTDLSSYINTAIAAVQSAQGGTLVFPKGLYPIASTIGQSGLRNVVIRGEGGLDLTYAGNTGTVIKFTGTGAGNIVNLQDHRGVWVRDLQVVYTSNSFTGTMFNCVTTFQTGCGSGFENVQCYQITNNGHTAGQCFYLRNNVDVTWRNCYVSHASIGWLGLFNADATAPTNETNIIRLYNCTAIALTLAAIVNPIIGWSCYGCNFEPSDTNAPAGILATGAHIIKNFSMYSCVFADAQANGTWINCPVDIYNFEMYGGAILTISGTVTAAKFGSAFIGALTFSGVLFDGHNIGIDLQNISTTGFTVYGCNFLNTTTKLSGISGVDAGSMRFSNNPGTVDAPFVSGILPIANGGMGVGSGAPIYTIAALAVNMNSVADTAFNITLPSGYTRYRIQALMVAHASADLTAATTVHYGLFTSTGGGGTAAVADTASTISATANSTNNDAQFIGPSITAAFNNGQLFFRVITAHGAAATADVYLQIQPLF